MLISPLALTATVGLVISTTASAGAVVINNGSFETNSLSDWTSTGVTTVTDANFGTTASAGDFHALLETDASTTGVNASALESFLNLPTASLTNSNRGVDEGSAIKQTITAKAGDVLSFDWNFLTEEPSNSPNNDFALFTVAGSFDQLADTSSPFLAFSYTVFPNETGYQTKTYQIPIDGTYILGFGVADVNNSNINSALLIDNVSLSESNPTPVPWEFSPGMGLILLAGWGAIAQLKSRVC